MTDTKSRRFSVHVPSDNQCLQSVYDYMAGSKKGLRTKVFEACESYYYPLALMDADTNPDEILDAAISAVNQLHQQIQYILEKLQQQGIQPTPAMLSKAGHMSPVPGSPANTIPTAPSISIASPSPQHLNTPAEPSTPLSNNDDITIKEDDDEDDWGEDPPLSAARLAYMKQSEEESRINNHG